METVAFWALHEDGTYRCPLPDVQAYTLSPLFCDAGAVSLTYPSTGRNFEVIWEHIAEDRDLPIAVWIDGQPQPTLNALVGEYSGDDVTDAAIWTLTGQFAPARLAEAIVAPHDKNNDPLPFSTSGVEVFGAKFAPDTAGTIVAILMRQAHARGTLTDLTFNFESDKDSAGEYWDKIITLTINPGVDYLTVLKALVDYGMCEFEVVNGELMLYNPGTLTVDRTTQQPPLVFRHGRDLVDSPRKHSLRNTATTLLVAGKDNHYYGTTDDSALARRGRRIEAYDSQGTISDEGTLAAYGQTQLEQLAHGKMEKTHGLVFSAPGNPHPITDFGNGDWAYSDMGRGLERLRIKQWTVSKNPQGNLSGTVVLNDLFAERTAALAQRISGLEGGTTITGLSTATDVPSDLTDEIAPSVPTGLSLVSLAYQSGSGVTYAAVTATWGEVTTNEDGTAIDDLGEYLLRWRYTSLVWGTEWQPTLTSRDPALNFSGVEPDAAIEVQVAARDRIGNTSPWSGSVFHTTQSDTTPPSVPSAPTITPYLGQLKVVWDGLGSAGETMPPDFARVIVHASQTAGFTPISATRVDNLVAAGTTVLTDLVYGTEYFVKLVAVDHSGNASEPSTQASGVPRPVGLGDITFKDRGNLVEDGSFEDPSMRAQRSSGPWDFTTSDARHGSWSLRADATAGAGTERDLWLTPPIPINPDEEFYFRASAQPDADADGGLDVTAVIIDEQGSEELYWTIEFQTADNIPVGEWTDLGQPFSASFIFDGDTQPTQGSVVRFRVHLRDTATTGTWLIDRVEARPRVGTLLVQDLAVTNAKIADLDVGKLTTGTLSADVLMAGRIRTSISGARVEISDTGIRKFDDANNLRVEITESDTYIAGELVTGQPGESRVEIGTSAFGRDNIAVYNGTDLTTLIGQVYSADTGDPTSNGLLVQRPNGQDLIHAYGISNNGQTGFNVIRSDNTSALYILDGQDEGIGLRSGYNNELCYLGRVNAGGTNDGMGLLIQATDGQDVLYVGHRTMIYQSWYNSDERWMVKWEANDRGLLALKGGGSPGVSFDATTLFGGFNNDSGFTAKESLVFHGNAFEFWFRDGAENTTVDIHAATGHFTEVVVDGSVVHPSSQDFKSNIQPLEESCLGKLCAVPIKRWERDFTHEVADSGRVVVEQRGRVFQGLGPLAEDMPDDLRDDVIETGDRKGINLTKSVWWLWAAVQELHQEVNAMKGTTA